MGQAKAAISLQSAGLPWLPPTFGQSETEVASCGKVVQEGGDHPRITSASILRAIGCPNSSPKQVISLFTAAVRQRGFRHHLPTLISLLPYLVRHGRIRAAEILLRRLPITGQRPGPSILLPLASSAVTAGIPNDCTARLLLCALPSASALSILLRALLRSGHLSLAHSLLSSVPDNLGFQIKIRHFAGLVREYCRRGDVDKAEELVLLMSQKGVAPDVETCNGLLAAVCDHRSVDDGFRLYLSMKDMNVSPDVITFSTLMGCLGMEGRVLGCNGLFGRMLVVGIVPDLPCYRILYGVYCKNFLLNDAVRVLRVIKSDGFLDDVGIEEKSILDRGIENEEVILCHVLKSGIIGGFMG